MDTLRKMIDIGLGLFAVSKETAQQLVTELVKKGEMTREEGERYVSDLTRRGEKLRSDLSEQIQSTVRAQVEKLNLATRDDLARLERRIAALEAAAQGRPREEDED